jgi:hypothetical protein
LVIIHLVGGPDGILTLDPKRRSEVAGWVENPLIKQNVESGNVTLGAHFAPLLPWATKMAIVKGVRVESVSHPSATWQLVRMRRRVNSNVPGILDIIARHGNGQPLGPITVGNISDRHFTPTWFPNGKGKSSGRRVAEQGFEPFEAMDPDDLASLARAMRKHAHDPSLRRTDRDGYAHVAAYLERAPQLTRFVEEDWKPIDELHKTAKGLQRVLWSLENDLTPGAMVVGSGSIWDSHHSNMLIQATMNAGFVALFARFLDQLQTRRNQHGLLAEHTTIVVSGELGRFPRVNSLDGKDHYPEMPMLFMGAGINTGSKGLVIGQTDKEMSGVPLDPSTGKLTGTRYTTLDDIGTTLLRMFGVEPTQYGYQGRPLEPLMV